LEKEVDKKRSFQKSINGIADFKEKEVALWICEGLGAMEHNKLRLEDR